MKKHIVSLAILLVGCGAAAQTQPTPTVEPSPQPEAPVPEAPPADTGLNDLSTMTFGCPKAALNAAAREAAKAPSQGTYQFAYFGIVSDSHHAAYEVHFKSNYQSEPVLKYCVAIYCQQGWDPRTTKTEVSLMDDDATPSGVETKPGKAKPKPGGAKPKAGGDEAETGEADVAVNHCDHLARVAASRAE